MSIVHRSKNKNLDMLNILKKHSELWKIVYYNSLYFLIDIVLYMVRAVGFLERIILASVTTIKEIIAALQVVFRCPRPEEILWRKKWISCYENALKSWTFHDAFLLAIMLRLRQEAKYIARRNVPLPHNSYPVFSKIISFFWRLRYTLDTMQYGPFNIDDVKIKSNSMTIEERIYMAILRPKVLTRRRLEHKIIAYNKRIRTRMAQVNVQMPTTLVVRLVKRVDNTVLPYHTFYDLPYCSKPRQK
jgi:hypothetical protein